MERCRYEAAIVRDGQILLVRHLHSSGRAFWNLPGGGQEENETERDCVRREVLEETHLDVEVGELLLDEPGVRRTYLCRVLAGEAQLGMEPETGHSILTELAWFSLSEPDGWEESVRGDAITSGLLHSVRDALGYQV